MERRSAIKSLLFIAGGMVILPSYSIDHKQPSIQLKTLGLDSDKERLLAEVTETFIPETDTPGGKALGLHLFVMKMVDDCHEKSEQVQFVSGLEKLEQRAKEQMGDSFIKLNKGQREKLLQDIETKKVSSEDVQVFYNIIKKRTIQGYLNSKYVMTKLLIYELVPGRYNGYFPVKKH